MKLLNGLKDYNIRFAVTSENRVQTIVRRNHIGVNYLFRHLTYTRHTGGL